MAPQSESRTYEIVPVDQRWGTFKVEADEYSIMSPAEEAHMPPRIDFKRDGKVVAHFFGVFAVMVVE